MHLVGYERRYVLWAAKTKLKLSYQ